MSGRIIAWTISLLILSPVISSAEQEHVNVELEVFQTLREKIEGISASNELVRTGLPFPQGMVREVHGRPALGLAGKEFQGRVLKRWPDGSVKWGLIEFLASPKNGKSERFHVESGPGVSSGKVLATLGNGRITVDTGPLQVKVGQNGAPFFDQVVIDGREVIKLGASKGIVLTDAQGREFLASACTDSRAAIEENGPVAATVRIDGGHCRGSERLLDYTMRLFFVTGKSRVKVQYTLRNASSKAPRHAFIRSLNLDTSLNLGIGTKALVATHAGGEKLDLSAEGVSFYQAVSDFPWWSDGVSFFSNGPVAPDWKRENQRGYKQEGYWLRQGGKLIAEGKRAQFPDLGYLSVNDETGLGVVAGIRYMAGMWPKALKADPTGNVQISLWPEENAQGYWIRFGSHTTYEVMYAFQSAGSLKPAEEMKHFQYPLMARAPASWYNRNVEGIYPLYHFISFTDEKKLAREIGADYGIGWRKPQFKVWRYHYWGHPAFLNQHDFGRIALVNALRDDRDVVKAGESYLYAESIFNYNADWSVYHSDDYNYSKQQFSPKENNDKAGLTKVVFEWEHSHWYGMPLYYYMTGDERVKEAVLDWGEYVKQTSSPLSMTYMRVFACGMYSLAALFEFTGDDEFMKLADLNFDKLLKVKYNPQTPYKTIFVNWERGYVAGGSGSGWPSGIKADLMMGSLLYDGLLNYYHQMRPDNQLRGEAEHLLWKMSEFMLREPYFEGTKRNHWAFWIPYVYNLTDREKSDHSYKLIGQATFWAVFPYVRKGETRWQDQMKKMMKMAMWDEGGVWGSYGYLDHPGFQTIGYYLLNGLGNGKNKAEKKFAVH